MKNRTKLVSLLLALALLLAMLPATVLAESPQENPPPVTGEYEVVITDCALPDYDDYTEAELLEGYLYSISGLYDGAAAFHAPRKPLNDVTLPVYNALVEKIKGVAAGTITDTVFNLGVLITWTEDNFDNHAPFSNLNDFVNAASKKAKGLDSQALMNRLLSQMPFELYWFDKTYQVGETLSFSVGYSISASSSNNAYRADVSFTVKMIVSKDYAPFDTSGGYAVDSDKIGKINTAVANATKIVSDNGSKTNYDKLVAYRNTICELVAYNSTAANNTSTPYGDPWQLIYVFDGNESTNVVCEGYSKAFKYLCDLTWQDNSPAIECSLVTGTMAVNSSPGPHMWNVVAIGGSNYLVDVTNCDTGTVGAPDKLFLCGATENVPSKKYTATAGSQSIVYEYDADTLSDYASSDLRLEEMPYSPTSVSGLTVSGTIRSYGSASESITVTLVPIGGSPLVKSVTGSSVTYSFTGVSAGNYTLKVEKKGHAPWTEEITVDSAAIAKDVTIYLYGDINGDGFVKANDKAFLARYLAYWPGYETLPVYPAVADLNGDGFIKANDKAILARYLAYWPGYETLPIP